MGVPVTPVWLRPTPDATVVAVVIISAVAALLCTLLGWLGNYVAAAVPYWLLTFAGLGGIVWCLSRCVFRLMVYPTATGFAIRRQWLPFGRSFRRQDAPKVIRFHVVNDSERDFGEPGSVVWVVSVSSSRSALDCHLTNPQEAADMARAIEDLIAAATTTPSEQGNATGDPP